MTTAKDIIVNPIKSSDAIPFVKAHHYSGKVAQNSQLHLGVFLNDRLHGVMQFGPSLDKRKIQGLVSGTQWHEFLELNRMAFDDVLPRNSESRALSVAWRLLRKHAPQVKWVVSFADGTQCGDGTIYRAAGFVLTGIKKNDQIWIAPDDGEKFTRICATDTRRPEYQRLQEKASNTIDNRVTETKKIKSSALDKVTKAGAVTHAMAMRGVNTPGQSEKFGMNNGAASMKAYIAAGFKPMEGFQLRYIYFIDPAYRARLTVPELPYSEIKARGASMYLGQRPTGGEGETDNAAQTNEQIEGASPISPLLEVNNGAP